MSPILVINGRPHLYQQLEQYCWAIETTTASSEYRTYRPGPFYALVLYRTGSAALLTGKATRTVRPSGRVMYAFNGQEVAL